MRYKNIKIFTALAVFICYMIALLTLQEHVIFYQEQHTLFLYSKSYFLQTLNSGGLKAYLGAFMNQFYYYPWLGAFIVSVMAACIYLFIENIIGIVLKLRDFLQVGVAAVIALYFTLDNINESPVYIFIAFLGMLLIWIVLSLFIKSKISNRQLTLPQLSLSLLLPIIFACVGLWFESKILDRSERAMILADKAVKQGNWDKAIEITSKYLATGRDNKLMHYLRSYALANKGELIDHLFDYPTKLNQQILAFPWKSDGREAEYGHLVHEATGDINAAHQWAFEAMTVWGETAPHLRDLARYNVVLGRPKVAIKLANKLGQSLFYKKDAEKIKSQLKNPEEIDLRYSQPDTLNSKWINVFDFRPNLMQNYLGDPENEMVRQYLMASLLLSNNLARLIPMLKEEDLKLKNIKEAILIYSLYPNYIPLKEFGLKIDESTGKDFANFYRLLKKGNREPLKKQYGQSYWYYKHVINPTEI